MDMYKIISFLFVLSHFPVSAEVMPILEDRDWTSKDGRVIKARLIKVEDLSITLKTTKDNKIHTLELEKFSGKDRLMVSDSQDKAAKIIENHNSKVKNLSWYNDWHFRNNYSVVPELALDELLLVHYFGKSRDLGIFAVKFTPVKFKVDTDKLNATMMGSEGFAVKAKAAPGWAFVESGQDLNVRPKVIVKGSTDSVQVAYANGTTVRLLFPNGRSISEGVMGIEECLILGLENFEPRFAR